jgi:hypothetical protein
VDTLSTWAESLHLGFDILGIKADNTSKFFRYGVTATFTQSGLTGTIILKEIYKVSIDSVIRYNGSDAAINTASLLAANVGLGKAQAVYGVTVVGVDLSQIPSLSSFCGGAFGAFDPSALGRIGTVWSDVNAAITAANPSVVKPVLSSVVLDLTANELQAKAMIAGMVAFALRKITCRMTLDQAVAQSPENYVDVVKRVYADLGVNGAPAAADVAYANSLLQLGK